VAILCGLTAGCQVYLNGGPGGPARHEGNPASGAAPSAAPYANPQPSAPVTAPVAVAPPETYAAVGVDDTTIATPAAPAVPPPAPSAVPSAAPSAVGTTDATAASATRPARSGHTTFPGERYYAAGRTWIVLEAVEDALEAADFHVLSSGTSTRGGEVHAERRQKLGSPRTSTSPTWAVQAAVVRIAGSTWEDCCYVKAAFTTTRLNSRGDVLGTTATDEPENQVLRSWFFDDVAARVPPAPAY